MSLRASQETNFGLGIRFFSITGVLLVIDRHALKARFEIVGCHFKSYEALPIKYYELNVIVREQSSSCGWVEEKLCIFVIELLVVADETTMADSSA